MVGFYVFGGGMGHLMRVRKFIDHRNITDFRIFTGNPLACRIFEEKSVALLQHTDRNVRSNLNYFLGENFHRYHFSEFYIDCFPGGILHELSEQVIQAEKVIYLARRLKKGSYDLESVRVNFDLCYFFEELDPVQVEFCRRRDIKMEAINLPLPNPDSKNAFTIGEKIPLPYWLIVHSSNIDEIDLLLMKASQMRDYESVKPALVLITDIDYKAENVITLRNEMRPTDYFPQAAKIFSGAGFNMIHELAHFRHKHVCLAFERKYDDQIWRKNEFAEISF